MKRHTSVLALLRSMEVHPGLGNIVEFVKNDKVSHNFFVSGKAIQTSENSATLELPKMPGVLFQKRSREKQ